MNPADTSRKKQLVTALAVLLAIVIIVGATVVATKNKSDNGESTNNTNSTNTTTQSENTSTSAETSGDGTYKNGTYSAEATYQSPGGTEGITVRVTIADGVVTDSSVTTDPTDEEAEEYQSMFLNGYKSQVNGKSIDSINLSRVSGSSLTSEGFNNAIDDIKQQAQS